MNTSMIKRKILTRTKTETYIHSSKMSEKKQVGKKEDQENEQNLKKRKSKQLSI